MKILVIADPHIPVPPAKYGGTERIADLLCRGLVQRGHLIRLLAGPGSRNYGGGLIVHRAPSLAYPSRAFRKIWFQYLTLRAVAGVDLVINFGRIDYLELLYRTNVPLIHWFQNPLTGREMSYLLSRRSERQKFVGVSRAQVSRDADAARFDIVHNSVNTGAIPFSDTAASPSYLLFLGRLTENKGVHLAIEAARRAGMKLVIAGNVPNEPGSTEFFQTRVKPFLGPQCEWVGPYDEATRIKLLSGASALLFPIQWNEPFAVVLVEALASGVPVIASRCASTPEAIVHGETGFLCDSVDDFVQSIHRVSEISRSRCRESVEQQFSEPVFMRKVEDLIARTLA